jgi:hypothetical protein
MKRDELDTIRERADAATQGATPEWYMDEDYKGTVRCAWSGDLIAQCIPTEADAEFIAHAREDIPKLLAEVERLKHIALELLDNYESSELCALNEFSIDICGDQEHLFNEIEQYKKEINGDGDDGNEKA